MRLPAPPAPRRPLPPGLLLLSRPARGPELAVAELVRLPLDDLNADTDAAVAAAHAAQQDAAARGLLGPHTVGLLVQTYHDQRVSPREMAMDRARGRPMSMTRKVRAWSAYRVRDRRLAGRLTTPVDLDRAVAQLLRRAA